MRALNWQNLIPALVFNGGLALNAQAFELVLVVDSITNPSGALMVSLADSEASFTDKTAAFKALKVPITQTTERINLPDVPAGDYAIKLYQDENNNGRLDVNVLGIPKEGYGFSNNGGAMGQPAFKEAKFTVRENTTITIHLR